LEHRRQLRRDRAGDRPLPASLVNGATSVAIVPLTEADAELVTWLLYSESEASPAVSMVLELAALIDAESRSIADAMRAL